MSDSGTQTEFSIRTHSTLLNRLINNSNQHPPSSTGLLGRPSMLVVSAIIFFSSSENEHGIFQAIQFYTQTGRDASIHPLNTFTKIPVPVPAQLNSWGNVCMVQQIINSIGNANTAVAIFAE